MATKYLAKVKHNNLTVYAHPTGIRVGTKGRVLPPKEALAPLTKRDRRKIRQLLHKAGCGGHAHASL